MSITITIVTTANRVRRFTQSDPARINEILESLPACLQLFSNPNLVVVSDNRTEIYCPSAITRIEIETGVDLAPYLPQSRNTNIRALGFGDPTPDTVVNEQNISASVDFYFEGGDSLSAWFEDERSKDALEHTGCITRLFEQTVIFYQPVTPGIGLINPALITRSSWGVQFSNAASGSWHVLDI